MTGRLISIFQTSIAVGLSWNLSLFRQNIICALRTFESLNSKQKHCFLEGSSAICVVKLAWQATIMLPSPAFCITRSDLKVMWPIISADKNKHYFISYAVKSLSCNQRHHTKFPADEVIVKTSCQPIQYLSHHWNEICLPHLLLKKGRCRRSDIFLKVDESALVI